MSRSTVYSTCTPPNAANKLKRIYVSTRYRGSASQIPNFIFSNRYTHSYRLHLKFLTQNNRRSVQHDHCYSPRTGGRKRKSHSDRYFDALNSPTQLPTHAPSAANKPLPHRKQSLTDRPVKKTKISTLRGTNAQRKGFHHATSQLR